MAAVRKEQSSWKDWIIWVLLCLLAGLYFWNLASVPFHPDEATHIYMSKDLAALVQNPFSLSWDGKPPLSQEERIRAIDAPLAKYVIGAARALTSTPSLEADWDWSASWLENTAAGALPGQRQLLSGRFAVVGLLLAGFWLYYTAVRKILPRSLALLAVLLLGLNPLVLLHSRRAMSEGLLIFGLVFFLWAVTRENRNPWLIGLALGLALNAKHSAIGILPAGLYGAALTSEEQTSLKKTGSRMLQFLLAAGLVLAALNPFYWKRPIKALTAGLQARSRLSAQQWADHGEVLGMEDAKLPIRGAAILAHTYVTTPQTEEVGNYLAESRSSTAAYFEFPLHSWGRGWIWGGISLTLSLVGFIFTIRNIWELPIRKQTNTMIWIISSLGMFLALLLPLPWQRYAIPLLPLAAFWTVSGLAPLVTKHT